MKKQKLTQEIKDWFGMGENDVDAMLAFGVVTEAQILQIWELDPSGKAAHQEKASSI